MFCSDGYIFFVILKSYIVFIVSFDGDFCLLDLQLWWLVGKKVLRIQMGFNEEFSVKLSEIVYKEGIYRNEGIRRVGFEKKGIQKG